MNIGIITTWFERGAAYVSKQFESILSTNHNVFIYARGGEIYAKGDPKWDKQNVSWGKRNLLYTTTQINIKHFKSWLTSNSIDLVIFNEQHEWEPVIACSETNVLTGAYIDYYKKETVPIFGIYDFLICNTKRHYSVFNWHQQAFYVPWGTDINLFSPQKKTNDDDKITFFHSCGMNPLRKGTDLLLEAYNKINRTESKLIIHTQVNIKTFFPDKSVLINKFLREGSLEIIEKSVHAPGLYHLGDVYVYPTRLEGIGLTIAEAISCGLPTIVTNQQPMNEFVQSEEAGRLIGVSHEEVRGDNYYWPQSIVDVNDLSTQMNFYINSKEHIKLYKEKAREYALKNLDWKKNLALFEKQLITIQKLKNSNINQLKEQAIKYDNKSLLEKTKNSLAYRKLRSVIKKYLISATKQKNIF